MKKQTLKTLKLFLVACFTFFLTECKGQAEKQDGTHNKVVNIKKSKMSEKFDVETYHKHEHSGSYEFNTKDGQVRQFSYEDGYVEEITHPNKLFKLAKDFYKNGNIKQKGLEFIKGGFMKGVWQFFGSSGNLLHEINYDSWYKFSWEDVQHFLQINHVHINDVIDINRTWKEGEKRVWIISYEAVPDKNGNFIREVTLNGETGKIEKDEWARPQRN